MVQFESWQLVKLVKDCLNYSKLIRLVIKPQVADCHTKGRQVQSDKENVAPKALTDAAPPKRKGKANAKI